MECPEHGFAPPSIDWRDGDLGYPPDVALCLLCLFELMEEHGKAVYRRDEDE